LQVAMRAQHRQIQIHHFPYLTDCRRMVVTVINVRSLIVLNYSVDSAPY
jgi:hypothetical protein